MDRVSIDAAGVTSCILYDVKSVSKLLQSKFSVKRGFSSIVVSKDVGAGAWAIEFESQDWR